MLTGNIFVNQMIGLYPNVNKEKKTVLVKHKDIFRASRNPLVYNKEK